MAQKSRIGLIGFGVIGSYVYEQIVSHPEWGLEVAFVAVRTGKTAPFPGELQLHDLRAAKDFAPDLIVEMAHPIITREWGEAFLKFSDYMPLSLTALADEGLESRLRISAERNGRSLYIPHGAAVGLDSLSECQDLWEEVTVIMKKNPR